MKKIFTILILLLFSINVLAQNLDVSIVSYDQKTKSTRIQIKNLADKDLHDVKIKVDQSREIPIMDLLKKGTTSSTFLGIEHGEHTIVVTSKEGITLTKKIYLSPTEEQINQDIEKERQLEQQREEKRREVEETYKKITLLEAERKQEKTTINYSLYIATLFIILIIALISYLFYLIFKKKPSKK